MARSNNGKKYAGVAAAYYAIDGLLNIYWLVVSPTDLYHGEIFFDVVWSIFAITFAVVLLIGHKRGIVGILGAYCMVNIICAFYYDMMMFGFYFWFSVAVYATLLVVGGLMLYGKAIVKWIWFVPGIVVCVCTGISWYQAFFSYMPLDMELIRDEWKFFLTDLFWCVSVICICLWIRENIESATAMSTNESAPNNTWGVNPSPTYVAASGETYRQRVFCRNCGTEMQDNESFCSNCGTARESNIANNVDANQQNYNPWE